MATDTTLDTHAELQRGLVKTGSVHNEGQRKTPTFLSRTVLGIGYVGSFLGSLLAREVVAEVANEKTGAYEAIQKEGIVNTAQKELQRSVDLKLWRSNVIQMATLFGGILLTNLVVKKVEQGTFKKRHGISPQMDQLRNSDTDSDLASISNWRDRVAKKEDPNTLTTSKEL